MERNFRQTLDFAKENELNILHLKVAEEVEAFNTNLDDKTFEEACSIVEDIYIRNEGLTLTNIVDALDQLNYQLDYDKIEDLAIELSESY